MATVIAFPKRELNSVENKSAKLLGPATIVMFTGVRMERLEDEPSQSRPTPRRFFATNSHATAEDLEN